MLPTYAKLAPWTQEKHPLQCQRKLSTSLPLTQMVYAWSEQPKRGMCEAKSDLTVLILMIWIIFLWKKKEERTGLV